jgi:hypothetical protein
MMQPLPLSHPKGRYGNSRFFLSIYFVFLQNINIVHFSVQEDYMYQLDPEEVSSF